MKPEPTTLGFCEAEIRLQPSLCIHLNKQDRLPSNKTYIRAAAWPALNVGARGRQQKVLEAPVEGKAARLSMIALTVMRIVISSTRSCSVRTAVRAPAILRGKTKLKKRRKERQRTRPPIGKAHKDDVGMRAI